MAVHNSYRASTRSHGPCYMDPRLQRGLRHPTSTPRTQPSRGQGSKPSGSKNHARPLSLPRAFRELGLRSPPAGRTRPALPPLGLRSPPAGPSCGLRPVPSGCRVRVRLASRERALCRRRALRAPTRLTSRERALHRGPALRASAAAAGTRAGGCGRRPLPPGRAPAAGTTSAAVTPAIFFGIFGCIFGDFSFFTLEAKSREICFRKLLLGHL